MFLQKLTYQNKQTGWTLQDLSLDRFNLLVGASGVGKTQILRALRSIHLLVTRDQQEHPSSFSFAFQHDTRDYTWEFESSASSHGLETVSRLTGASPIHVIREKLTSSTDGVLVERDTHKFLFKGKELPQLSSTATAFRLLNEPVIDAARSALITRLIDDHPYSAESAVNEAVFDYLVYDDLDDFRLTPLLNAPLAAFVLQKHFPEQFERIKATFIEIFPSVEDVAIERSHSKDRSIIGGANQQLRFTLKERGIPYWVAAKDISSGMVRTLVHIIDLTLAPKDSVVLIDEFENSLGVNCMGPLTDFIQSRAHELQFIITSHHPYIINKIPKSHWKVVRRHGSTVRVTPASEIKALQGASAQDDFTRLLNAPEFEEGMA